MKRFPIDCTRDCSHFHIFEIGDGFSANCDLLDKEQDDVIMDLFDGTFLPICPLEGRKETE
ncbi:MAG: hypothetical protein J6Y02_13020 [Pseudobutyrivibrio sp.]|nr:hypothetical protein [Pseudobutyrivibrio sp.]